MRNTETTKGEKKGGQGLARGALLFLFTFQVSAFSLVFGDTHYVDIASTNAAAPYTNWATAATVIQDAIDQAESNDTVRVADGVYSNGGVAVYGSMTNRVAVNKAITVQSVNGAGVTAILGRGPVGDGAVRCAYVTNGAVLAGFTLTNGATRSSGGDYRESSGGGVWCENNGVVSNCVIVGNVASDFGGGSCYGRLYSCTLLKNTTSGLFPSGGGGGSYFGSLYNCVLSGNVANQCGGGSYQGNLNNCTVSGNTAYFLGGGSYFGSLCNCIVYFNLAPTFPNNDGGTLSYSCTSPLSGGIGNIGNDPMFANSAGGDYRLKLTSPCIDKGVDLDWMTNATDLVGNPRILNGKVDMGTYETAFYATPKVWLQGAYDTNQNRMTTALSNNVPLTSPYKADARGISSIPSNVTDWVMVQIRETNGNSIVSRSAFVNRDGYVLADNGSTGIVVDVSPGTNCYLVLQHRNHLSVMSAQPLVFTNLLTTYDFTTNWTCHYGGSNGCVQLKPGVWGMIAGDADGDGKITETDRKIVEQQKGRAGYLPGDLDLNGVVE